MAKSKNNNKYVMVNPFIVGKIPHVSANKPIDAANELWRSVSKNFANNVARTAFTIANVSEGSLHSFEVEESKNGNGTAWMIQKLQMKPETLDAFQKKLDNDITDAERLLISRQEQSGGHGSQYNYEEFDDTEQDTEQDTDEQDTDEQYTGEQDTDEYTENHYLTGGAKKSSSLFDKKTGKVNKYDDDELEFALTSLDDDSDDSNTAVKSDDSDDSDDSDESEENLKHTPMMKKRIKQLERKRRASENRNGIFDNTYERLKRLIPLSSYVPRSAMPKDMSDILTWTYYTNLYQDMDEVFLPIFYKNYPEYMKTVFLSKLISDIIK